MTWNKGGTSAQQAKRAETVREYKAAIDAWNGKDDGGYFRLGATPEKLLVTGIPQAEIYFDKSKASQSLTDHKEVTPDVLKAIPDVLADPVVVTESYDNTALVFGELFDEDGRPIVIALQVNSTARGNSIEIVNKVRSVGIRTHNLDKLIADENVVFLSEDKERADTWFQALGRSTPFGGTTYGSIRMLSFADQNVKTDGKTERYSYAGSVKDSMADTWGVNGLNSVENMMRDVQNGPPQSGDAFDRVLNSLRSHYAKATLELNLGVAIKQAASYPAAADVEWAQKMGLLMGDDKGDLKLHETLTREQKCVMDRRLYNLIMNDVRELIMKEIEA